MKTNNKWKTLENTDENSASLAELVVEGWDLGTLMEFAVGVLTERYQSDKATFQNDAENEDWFPTSEEE
jgi:hypothetical protein